MFIAEKNGRGPAPQTSDTPTATAITSGDIDGDGVIEIAIAIATDDPLAIEVYTLSDDRLLEREATLPIAEAVREMRAVELDGDGEAELVTAEAFAGLFVRRVDGTSQAVASRGAPNRLRLGEIDGLAAHLRGPLLEPMGASTWIYAQALGCSSENVVGDRDGSQLHHVTLDLPSDGEYEVVTFGDSMLESALALAPCAPCPWLRSAVHSRGAMRQTVPLSAGRYVLSLSAPGDGVFLGGVGISLISPEPEPESP